jgi:acyl dehydratase
VSEIIESERDLVGDAGRALVGKEVVRRSGRVRREAFQRWAAAVEDNNPLYFDDAYARGQGYREAIAPPMFLPDAVHAVVALGDMSEDGIPQRGEVFAEVDLPRCPRRMAAGGEITFHEPLHDGDQITLSSVIESIVQKHGRSGDFVLITWLTTYTREGSVVANERRSVIARP